MSKIQYVNGVWQVDGVLPSGLVFKNNHFEGVNGEQEPECLGDLWDGSNIGEEDCRTCIFTKVCLEKMAKVRLPAMQAELGSAATVETLAKRMEIQERSVMMLIERAGIVLPKRKKRPDEIGQPVATAGVADANPMIAPSVYGVRGGAKLKKVFVKTARAQGAGSQMKPPYYWHNLEREKQPLIGKLLPGMVLRVKRAKKVHFCRCNQFSYQYKGEKYETLQQVTNRAAGMVAVPKQLKKNGTRAAGTRLVCPWNATRFWKLKQKLSQL